MEERMCHFQVEASRVLARFHSLLEPCPAQVKSLGLACWKMKDHLDQKWPNSALLAEAPETRGSGRGGGKKGIFDISALNPYL